MKHTAFFLLSALLSCSACTISAGDDYVHAKMPKYPPASVRLNETGVVKILALVQEDGRVSEVSIVESSGYPRLDKAALDAARQWIFRPKYTNSSVIVPVRFRLAPRSSI